MGSYLFLNSLMKKKFKKFNNPPFFLADSIDDIPNTVKRRIVELGINQNTKGYSIEFMIWVKAYVNNKLWGNNPYLLFSDSAIYGFDFHDFKTIKYSDIKNINLIDNQIIINLTNEVNEISSISLVTAFELNKSLINVIVQRLKRLCEGYSQEIPKVPLFDSNGEQINENTDILNDPNLKTEVIKENSIDDSFKKASPMMKIYTVIFWLFLTTYIVGGVSLNTWNPNEMYKAIISPSTKSSKSKDNTNGILKEQRNKGQKEIYNQSDNYCYKYEIKYSSEASNGTGFGVQTSEFVVDEKIENYDELSEEAIRQLWYNHCIEDLEDGWKYWNFSITRDGYFICN